MPRWDSHWVALGATASSAGALEQAKLAAIASGRKVHNQLQEQWALRNERARVVRAPLLQIVQNDASAREALARSAVLFDPFTEVRMKTPVMSSTFELTLNYDYKTALPPYDGDWSWSSNDTAKREVSASRGTIYLYGASGDFRGGNPPMRAGGGIMLVLTTDRDSFVEVRPLISGSVHFLHQPYGIGSEAGSKGGLDIAVFDDGSLIEGPHRVVLWDHVATGFSKKEVKDGPSCWPTISCSFMAQCNRPYVVNVGLWIECENDSGFGVAQADCEISGVVNSIFVQRIAGP